jgi:hypothetical protein
VDVPTITMDVDVAREKYDHYRAALESRDPTPEDNRIVLGYKALAAGKQLLDLHQVFKGCPLDEAGRPRLAVGRASWQWCHLNAGNEFVRGQGYVKRMRFADSVRHLQYSGPIGKVIIPAHACPPGKLTEKTWRAMVPPVPLPIRPKGNLHEYHVLWEAEWQQAPPVDPLLLSRLAGSLYVILAWWDLTELERAVLAGRFAERVE